MENGNLSPKKKALRKKESEKFLAKEIYERIFNAGVEKTAEIFFVKPEEVTKLVMPIIRKNKEFDKFQTLVDKQKLFLICDKIKELQTFSTRKLFEHCELFAKEWEILIAREFLRQNLNRESFD